MSDLISRETAIAAIEQARQAFALPDDVPGSRMVNAGFAAARGALEKVPSAPEWVSVNDRLPEMYNSVLVFSRRVNKMFTAFLSNDPRFRGNKVWILCGGGVDCIPDVTHWTPLPAPPTD